MDNMESRLRAAWCQVLSVKEDEIDSNSHFFKEGGDSVAAMRLVGIAEDYRMHLTLHRKISSKILTKILSKSVRNPAELNGRKSKTSFQPLRTRGCFFCGICKIGV